VARKPVYSISPRKHLVAAVVACLLSLGLHVAVLRGFPELHIGLAAQEEKPPRFPSLRVEEVIVKELPGAKRPGSFRPTDPGRVAEVFGQPDAAAELDPGSLPLPPPVATRVSDAKGASEPVAEVAVPSRIPAWEPRQEIIRIQEKVLKDEVATLPRRYDAVAARAQTLHDIVLPADREPAGVPLEHAPGVALEPGATLEQLWSMAVEGGRGAAVPGGARAGGFGVGGGGGGMEDDEFGSGRGDEDRLRPAEQYLDLEVYAFRPPDEAEVTYFAIQIKRHGESALPVLPKDVFLIQDCSQSMTPWKLSECKSGLRKWIDTLKPEDRFDVMSFRETTQRCFDRWVEASPETKARASLFVDSMRSVGNTDMYLSLEEALATPGEAGRPRVVVVVTDGRPTVGVTSTTEIIEKFTAQNAGQVSVFTLSGGKRVNRFLLDFLSYRNRGDSTVVVAEDRIPEGMEQVARELSRPVLVDLSYRFSGIDEADVYPRTLTHLYLDRPLVLYGRATSRERAAFQIVGRSREDLRDIVYPLDLDQAGAGTEDIRRSWVWHTIYEKIGQYVRSRQSGILEEAKALAVRYGVTLPYSFDESPLPP
jgi:hypothetical protein